jgi:hypothetical protein
MINFDRASNRVGGVWRVGVRNGDLESKIYGNHLERLNGIYKRDVEVGLKKGRECVEKSIRVSKSIEVSKAWMRKDGSDVNLRENLKIYSRILGIKGKDKGSLSHKRNVSAVLFSDLGGDREPSPKAYLV